MAEITESLKKLSYENLQQFVEDINRNFAIIQNSPLYKGIPGDRGEDGLRGLRGERGSRFFFIDADAFISAYPGEISNINSIDQIWINRQLSDLTRKEKLLKLLGVNSFVDTDLIVLNNTKMIQYKSAENSFNDTGVSFYQQNTLISSIENKINTLIQQYINNNPKILSIKNILIHYKTYAKVYSSTNNSYISQNDSDSAVYMPYFAGITDNQGALIGEHTYFGFSDEEFPIGNKGAFIIGSVGKYATLLSNTLSTNERSTFSSDFAPTKNNLPNLIILQDTKNNGIMFGYKNNTNLSRFGSIYKDAPIEDDLQNEFYDIDIEAHNIVIKSDQGINPLDFSKLLINRYRLRYDKQVFFDDNLTVAKDFCLIGNIENTFIRTAEFIKSKYTDKDLDTTAIRANTIEVGKLGSNSRYINISQFIELPNFADENKLSVLTVNRPKSNANLSNDYFIEEGIFKPSTNLNLDDFEFIKTSEYDYDENFGLVRTIHLLLLVNKLNNIQQFIKENYWMRSEWENTERGNSNNVIPLLNVGNTHIDKNDFIIYNEDTRNIIEEIFHANSKTNTLALGFYKSDENQTQINIPTKNIYLKLYNLFDNEITKNNRQANQLLTADDYGNLTNSGIFIGNSDVINNYISIDNEFPINNKDKNTLVNLNTFGILQNLLVNKFKDINDNYWRKEDFSTPPNSLGNNVSAGKIPNIYVLNALGGNYLEVKNHKLTEILSELKPTKEFILETPKVKIDSETITLPKNKSQVLVTNSEGTLFNDNKDIYIIETAELPEITKDNIKFPVTLPVINANHHIITTNYILWLNNRLNIIVEKGLGDDFWKKSEFIGDENGNYVIPTLNLKESLNVAGTVFFYNTDKTCSYFSIVDNTVTVGYNETNFSVNSKVRFGSKRTCFDNIDYAGIVLATWETDNENEDNDIETVEQNETKTIVKHDICEIRKDIKITNDSGLTQSHDNEVPLSVKDKERSAEISPADAYKTKDKHKLLSGRTLKWIMEFMNNVKKRFSNTFNKIETMQQMHDMLPVGSIIMWTKTSYDLACEKDPNFKGKKERSGIPNGWWPCNGTKIAGTNLYAPDMRNQFVRGVSNIANAIGTGGRNKYKLYEGQLPNLKHTHGMEQSGNHSHLLSTKESDIAMYTGEFVYKNDVSSENTIRKKIGVACDETGSYSENSPILIPKTNYVKLKNIKIPVIVTKVSSDNLATKNNWFVENIKKDATTSGGVFKFSQGISAGISLFDYIRDFLSGNAFEISNMQDDIDISKHRHTINETGLGMSTTEKQGYIYTVPEYYKVIFIMKYDNSINPNSDPIPDPIELVPDLPADDGVNYEPPTPDQSSDSKDKQEFLIKITTNDINCDASINESVRELRILEGDSIRLIAIPGPSSETYYYQLRYWECDNIEIPNSYDINGQSEKIGKKEIAVIPTNSCIYKAVFDKIDINPEPIVPKPIDPIVNVNAQVTLEDYDISEIDYIEFPFKGKDSSVATVNIKTTLAIDVQSIEINKTIISNNTVRFSASFLPENSSGKLNWFIDSKSMYAITSETPENFNDYVYTGTIGGDQSPSGQPFDEFLQRKFDAYIDNNDLIVIMKYYETSKYENGGFSNQIIKVIAKIEGTSINATSNHRFDL